MKEQVTILVVVPYDLYFATEIEVQCENFKKFGYLKNTHFLIYEQGENVFKEYWIKLQERYSDAKFFFYKGDELKKLTPVYASVCRPNCLKKHFAIYPELKDHTILYLDGDVLFTRKFEMSEYLNDDICYLSKTNYIAASYFEKKRNDVFPFKLKEYNTRDILQECCNIVGVDKQTVIDNEDNTGGCQYLLKNIDVEFWEKLEKDCIMLRQQLLEVNNTFFVSEDKGFQSWAIADMCGLLWNLWKRGLQTKCPDSMNFSWSSSPIEKYKECVFFHNAGITGKYMKMEDEEVKMYHKGDIRFRTSSISVFDIEHWGNISKKYCSFMYINAINAVVDPICVTKKLTY